MYFGAYCVDRHLTAEDEEEGEKWNGFLEVLTPIMKAYVSDIAFRVTETAIQVYGGYGYCSEYPLEQFMRDEKIASLYEGANGIQALDLVGRKLGMKKGTYFLNMLGEMNATVAKYKDEPALKEFAGDMQAAVNALPDVGMFFAQCGKEGKFMVPLGHAYPFLMMMGKVASGWLLFWEAGIASQKLDALSKDQGVDPADPAKWTEFIQGNRDAAFYTGKIAGAKYFIRNVLPEVDAAVKAIKSEDLSIMEIPEEGFAS
jgi:hypothetical protein